MFTLPRIPSYVLSCPLYYIDEHQRQNWKPRTQEKQSVIKTESHKGQGHTFLSQKLCHNSNTIGLTNVCELL